LAGLAGKMFVTKHLFQQFFKMKTYFTPSLPHKNFTPSSAKNILLSFMTFLIG